MMAMPQEADVGAAQSTSRKYARRANATGKLTEAVHEFQNATANRDFQAPHLLVFLYLASTSNAVSSPEVERNLGLNQSNAFRILQMLGRKGRPISKDGKMHFLGGAKLVESFIDPRYRKNRLYRLTKKGDELADKLTDIIED